MVMMNLSFGVTDKRSFELLRDFVPVFTAKNIGHG